jgi:hypothetical protein
VDVVRVGAACDTGVVVSLIYFGDDSWDDEAGPPGLLVTAEVPPGEYGWLFDVGRRAGRFPPKSRDFEKLATEGHSDLSRRALSDISGALISVADERQRVPDRDGKLPWLLRLYDEAWERLMASRRLLHGSPLYDAAEALAPGSTAHLERDLDLPDVPTFDDKDPLRFVFEVMEAGSRQLKKGHNARLFASRSAASFADWRDPAAIAAALDRHSDRVFYSPETILRDLAARALNQTHIFDTGNTVSTRAMNRLRSALTPELWDPIAADWPREFPIVEERKSNMATPQLLVADIAAGRARRIFIRAQSAEVGIRHLCDDFSGVIYNGRLHQRA